MRCQRWVGGHDTEQGNHAKLQQQDTRSGYAGGSSEHSRGSSGQLLAQSIFRRRLWSLSPTATTVDALLSWCSKLACCCPLR